MKIVDILENKNVLNENPNEFLIRTIGFVDMRALAVNDQYKLKKHNSTNPSEFDPNYSKYTHFMSTSRAKGNQYMIESNKPVTMVIDVAKLKNLRNTKSSGAYVHYAVKFEEGTPDEFVLSGAYQYLERYHRARMNNELFSSLRILEMLEEKYNLTHRQTDIIASSSWDDLTNQKHLQEFEDRIYFKLPKGTNSVPGWSRFIKEIHTFVPMVEARNSQGLPIGYKISKPVRRNLYEIIEYCKAGNIEFYGYTEDSTPKKPNIDFKGKAGKNNYTFLRKNKAIDMTTMERAILPIGAPKAPLKKSNPHIDAEKGPLKKFGKSLIKLVNLAGKIR